MKKITIGLLAATLALVAGTAGACADKPVSDPLDNVRENKTLLNGFENADDLYAVRPIGVQAGDEMKYDINTDAAYIKSGKGSLKYEYVSGTAHTLLQYAAQSHLPDLNVKELKKVSAEIYNASEQPLKVTISVTGATGAALFGKQFETAAGEWTTIAYDGLDELSYKQKSGIAGFSIRFDVHESAVFYVDDLLIEGGAEDLPPFDLGAYVDSIVAPETPLNRETLEDNLLFLDGVTYARDYVNSLSEEERAGVPEQTISKISALEVFLGDYGSVYSARFEDNKLEKWSYGNGLITGQGKDEEYGAVWTVAVNTAPGYEQSFKWGEIKSLAGYGDVFFYVYNPTNYALKMNISGGWKLFNFISGVDLAPMSWTKVQFSGYVIENDETGWLYSVIHSHGAGDPAFEGVFKFTGLYAEKAEYSALKVSEKIEVLPAASEITVENVDTYRKAAQDARALFDRQTTSTRNAVTNAEKLERLEDKIATLDAAATDALIEAIGAVTADSEKAIKAARNSYNALSALAKEKVTLLAALVQAENDIIALQTAPFNQMIDSLDEEALTNADVEKIAALIDVYNSMSASAKQALTDERVNKYNRLVSEKAPELTAAKIAALPDISEAEMPRDYCNFDTTRKLWEKLDNSSIGNLPQEVVDKYNSYSRLAAPYTPVYPNYDGSPSDNGIQPDVNYQWGGTIEFSVDSSYGEIVKIVVTEGHTNMPDKYPNNESNIGVGFVSRELNALAENYSEVVFYVFNPLNHNVTAHGMYGNWKYTSDTYTLKALDWTKIVVSTEKLSIHPRNMLWFKESEYGAGGFAENLVWKISAFYGVDPSSAALKIIDCIAALPAQVTAETLELARAEAMKAREAYDAAVPAVKNLVSNYDKLLTIEAQITRLDDEAAAKRVNEELNALESETIDSAEKAVTVNERLSALKIGYASLSQSAKNLVTDFNARVAALQTKVNAFMLEVLEAGIDALPEPVVMEPYYVSAVNEASAKYAALSEEDKAKVNAEKAEKLVALKTIADSYITVYDVTAEKANDLSTYGGTASGTVENATFGTVLHRTAASYFALDKRNGLATNSADCTQIVFYIYNNSDADVSGYYAEDATWKKVADITLKANQWTKVTVDVSVITSTNQKLYFYVAGDFYFSDIFGIPEAGGNVEYKTVYDVTAEKANETSTYGGAASGTVEDATFGTVLHRTVTSSATCFTLNKRNGLAANSADCTQIVFYIYNNSDAEVRGHYTDDVKWAKVADITLKANQWTKVTVDVSVITATNQKLYFYVAGDFYFSDIFGIPKTGGEAA